MNGILQQPDPKAFGKVAVLMGGLSAEREVSLHSGAGVLAALQRQGVDAHGVDAGRDLVRVLADQGFNRAFIILHGTWGEDGVVQGALEMLGLPYTGSGVLASALGMDKLRSKRLFECSHIPTPAYALVDADTDWAALIAKLGAPLAVKPNAQGSSVGVTKARNADDLRAGWEAAREYDATVIAEHWVTGREITATVLGDTVLPLVHIEVPGGFYDYNAKYLANDTRYHCPAALDADLTARVQELARDAFELLGCRHWGRVDFMVTPEGVPYVLEVNTVPGMTDHSLVPMAARAAGMDFDALVMRILSLSLEHG